MLLVNCPLAADLERFFLGDLPEPEAEALDLHVLQCAACLERLKALPRTRDTLTDALRGDTHPDPSTASPRVVALVKTLKSLCSSPPPLSEGLAMLSFCCSSCQKHLAVKEALAGKKVKCPGCGQVVDVPAPVAPASHPEERTLDCESASAFGEECNPQSTSAPTSAGELQTPSPGNKLESTIDIPRRQGGTEPSLTDFLSPAQSADELGRLGKYRILKVLGHGGMGVVFKAEDPRLKRHVALKAMLPTLAASASAGQRFLREAQSMAAVEHDHIVRVHEVAEERGVPFLAMEFLKGEPLDVRLGREKLLPILEVVRLGKEIAAGLAAAHEHGLIHRDIKPANVWLEAPDGRVKILDFGLARSADQEAGLTQQGTILGTPAYMAPEQGRGDTVEARSDLFSLGVILYRLCSGKAPFRGTDTISTLLAVATEQPPPPSIANPDLPTELSDLVMQLLEKDTARRPASAREVMQVLRSLEKRLTRQQEAADSTQQFSASPSQSVLPTPRARRWWPVVLGAAALLLLIGGGYAIYQIVIIRDKGGKEVARIKVPEGGKAEVVPDAKPGDAKDVPWAATPAQQTWLDAAAKLPPPQQLESINRKMKEESTSDVTMVLEPKDGLPTKCKITGAPDTLWPLLALPSLTSLDLTEINVTDFRLLTRLPLTELHVNLVVDNVKSEKGLKSIATLKSVNGRPAADYWADRAALRKEIDDMVERAPALSLEDRKVWFDQMMKKLNPKYLADHCALSKDGGTGLTTLQADGEGVFVFDVSPVRGLGVEAVSLRRCSVCDLTPLGKSKIQALTLWGMPLRDLTPLAGLPLQKLSLGATQVADLSPLKGMKLEEFVLVDHLGIVKDFTVLTGMPLTSLSSAAIRDLRPFKAMKLKSLLCGGNTDLSPVAWMPLESLQLGGRCADYSPLAGMKLKHFAIHHGDNRFHTYYEPEEKMFRAMPLETIHDMPAAEFWKAYDAEKKAIEEFVSATAKLTPEKAAEAVKEAVKKHPPVISTETRIEDGAVVEFKVHFNAGESEPFALLRAFPKLKKITIQSNTASWSDLSPVMNLPIEEIECNPEMIPGNAMILARMPKLQTINGKPAKEVLDAVK
jgi:serine/threonine protein kinase